VSVHLYLLIRSRLDPGINEADPSNWSDLWLVLTRDQYKPGSPFVRRAPLWYQIDHMFLRYLRDQFVLGGGLGAVGRILPLLLGLWGAIAHAGWEKKGFLFLFLLFFWTGPFLIFYLNFKEGEVRERDYFFVMSFHYFAIWIGLGVADLALRLRAAFLKSGGLARGWVPAWMAAWVLVSLLPIRYHYATHDRSRNWVAHGYGHNMLVGLGRDAILFTNGDNDTFPLWYMQEVEGFRRDVRVVNLSLLNTPWYLRQLRDVEPKVPVTWDDDQIAVKKPVRLHSQGLEPYLFAQRDRITGQVVMLKDMAVYHILEQNAYKRPVYLAVTVPDQMGLEKRLQMEGLVFRILSEEPADRVNVAAATEVLHTKYHYRGLLRPPTKDGFYDRTIFKDENEERLIQNYSAAFVRLAYSLYQAGRMDEAIAEMERAAKISISFPGVLEALGAMYKEGGRLDRAEVFVQELIRNEGESSLLMRYLADVQAEQGQYDRAVATYRRAIVLDPDHRDAYWNLFLTLWDAGRNAEAVSALDDWLKRVPGDDEVRRARDAFQDSVLRQG
jgi:tetratricopeptide (TPR) repeat protein